MAAPLALQCSSLSPSPSSPASAAWAAWAPVLPAAWPSAKASAPLGPGEALLGAARRPVSPVGPVGPAGWRFPPAWAAAVSRT